MEEPVDRSLETDDSIPTEDTDAITIYIDRNAFRVSRHAMTGALLRQLPAPPLHADFDLFRVAPGDANDLLVQEDELVELEDGTRFFSAPQRILAG
jgi:hypothetical protein